MRATADVPDWRQGEDPNVRNAPYNGPMSTAKTNMDLKHRLTDALELDPACTEWTTESHLLATLIRQILTGRTLLTRETRAILDLDFAVTHLADILSVSSNIRERDTVQILSHMGEAWMDRCLDAVRALEAQKLSEGRNAERVWNFTLTVARHAMERMQPQWFAWLKKQGLDSPGAIHAAIAAEGKSNSGAFLDKIRQPTFARVWEHRNARDTLNTIAGWATERMIKPKTLGEWINTELVIAYAQGEPRGTLDPGMPIALKGVFAPTPGPHARVAMLMRAIQDSDMIRFVDGSAPGLRKPVAILDENIADAPTLRTVMEVIQGLHGSSQILPDPDGAWAQAVFRILDSKTQAMEGIRFDLRWTRDAKMPDAEERFRTWHRQHIITEEVRNNTATRGSQENAKAIAHPEKMGSPALNRAPKPP